MSYPHLARSTLIAAGQPAWPAAVEFFAAVSGSTLANAGNSVRFEPPEVADDADRCAVGTDSTGEVWWIDESGGLWEGSQCRGDGMRWLLTRKV